LTYWLASKKTPRDLGFALGMILTVMMLMLGGLQDILFFVLWGDGLPPNTVVWWWVPWVHVLGSWTSTTQIIFTTTTLVAVALMWVAIHSSFPLCTRPAPNSQGHREGFVNAR
jgi:hypothetical protein